MDYKVSITVDIYDCKDKQEAINFVADNIGLSEFNLTIDVEKIICLNIICYQVVAPRLKRATSYLTNTLVG